MRKLLFIFALLLVVATSYAQRKGLPITVTASEADTSNGAETDYITIPNIGGFSSETDLSIQILCANLGGTSEGTITLEKSQDGTTYVPMNTTVDSYLICANDSATITDAAKFIFTIPRTYDYKYRLKITGASGDSTLFTTKYRYQDVK